MVSILFTCQGEIIGKKDLRYFKNSMLLANAGYGDNNFYASYCEICIFKFTFLV
jgi:hypothetical protein